MKLQKTIESFKVEVIASDHVILSCKDGSKMPLRVGDRVEAVHQLDVNGDYHPQGCHSCGDLTEVFLNMGFSYPVSAAQ